jgi:EAL domain-containing protein (putative c-di-GMP-specific phosphodiesterase class I)
MTEGPQAISTLQQCRGLGYKIAIDDFGTGFSSLQYLASMPLHDLKVDRSFVHQMMTDDKSLSIVKTLIHLANLLNLNLIAEGIETADQQNRLHELGVQMGQGYYFAKPMALGAFAEMLFRLQVAWPVKIAA